MPKLDELSICEMRVGHVAIPDKNLNFKLCVMENFKTPYFTL